MPASLLRVLTCGSVDDGKSTLLGRLLAECGAIPEDVLVGLERDSRRWGTVGDGQLDYALLVDGLAAEREQGVTIDVAYRYFETPRRRFILADAPGHQQYTRNMVTGASTSDLAVLLVDARKGLLAQTRRHAAIASLLGIRDIVLAVNKMDLVGFDPAVFEEITAAFTALLDRLGDVRLTAIPVVARDGDNVTGPSARMPWYQGPSVLAALEQAEPRPAVPSAFRMPGQWGNRPDHLFRGYAGTLAGGTLRPGDLIANSASGLEARVTRIVTMDGDRESAAAGDPVTLVLDREIDVSRGDVLAAAALPKRAESVDAWIVWMDETPLFRGRAYHFLLGTRSVIGTVTEITTRLDVDSLTETPVRELALNEIGRVSISLSHPVVCEPYAESRTLGGFILVDRLTRNTVGAGLVTALGAARNEVHWQRLDVDKAARGGLMGQTPAVLWFTGLSGAGKSTIANLVEKRLHAMGRHTMILDGDNVRHGLNKDLGFSEADRVENIRRVAEVAKLFVEAGLIVLVSFISPYRSERMLARDSVEAGEFLEIFVDTPVDECRRRDPKGLYRKADAGQIRNFTGVDAPYEPPVDPEIRLQTLEAPPEALAEQVVDALRARGLIG